MKSKNVLGVLLVAFLVFASAQACFFTASPSPSAQPDVLPPTQPPSLPLATVQGGDSQFTGDLGSITYTLDTARQVSQNFDINAGKDVILTTKDANGYAWMLSIPADALYTTTKITMTPFATIDYSRSVAKIFCGVQLEPDGLQFADAVRLSVTAPIDNPGVGLIFSFDLDGSGVRFAPTTNTPGGKTAVANIWHFSSAGNDNKNHSGDDYMEYYRKLAEIQYYKALDAARQFINNPPIPPAPPMISMFCRGTEVNPEQGEAYEFYETFYGPYEVAAADLINSIKILNLNSNMDTSDGMALVLKIILLAEKNLVVWGRQAVNDKPPDRLFALVDTGIRVLKRAQIIGGIDLAPDFQLTVTYWQEVLRDYYLDQLKTKHDYRAFPILISLEKKVVNLGGTDRLAEIVSAMTFEVIIDASFDGTWLSSGKTFATGHAEQHADIFQVKSTQPPDLWAQVFDLKVTSGTFTDPKGTYSITGQLYIDGIWLKNWDACVTKSFDVMLSGFSGVEDVNQRNVAGAASRAGFKQYWWDAGFFMFTVPMQNLNKTLGDQNFSGSGSAADGAFTGTGKIHIVIKHTP